MGNVIQQAMGLARAGQLEEAADLLERMLADEPRHANALQVLGLIKRRQGDLDAAESFLRRSLAADPGQAHVFNNLGNVLSDRGQPRVAIDCYRAACSLQPDYFDAHLNLGIGLLAHGDAGGALAALDDALAIDPGRAGAWVARGNALQKLQRAADAEAAYRKAIQLEPKRVNALHNLGVLCKMQGRTAEALELLESAAGLSPRRAEIHYNRGHALLAAGRVDDAIDAYGVAVQLEPGYAAAHDSLNKVMWQHGRHDDYLSSYARAVGKKPEAEMLWIDWADKLMLAGRSADAVAVLERSVSAGHASAGVRHGLARALAGVGRVAEAEVQFRDALSMAPRNTRYLKDLARLQIVQARYEDALRNLDSALEQSPYDQEAIAYRGVCWRLLGDSREAVLNDYDYVRTFRLPSPPGHATIEAFNEHLLPILDRLHGSTEAPAEQTLRGGTQTLDDLFEHDIPELALLRAGFETAVARYVDELAGDPEQPFLQRRSGAFRFSGSWSVRLRSAGFHVNHLHSEGWISSCYYVSVPDCVADERTHPGWLRFGESNLQLGEREVVARLVRPESGLLVLFPSYFFHGTIPFHADQDRVTVAFDAVPA